MTLNGTIRLMEGASMPETPKVLVIWQVTSASPDYAIIYRVGTLDVKEMTFSIELPEMIPDTACNGRTSAFPDRRAGVAAIVLISDPMNLYRDGVRDPGQQIQPPFGFVNNTAVIYRRGNDDAFTNYMSWFKDFEEGLSLGIGVDPGPGFDIFVPISKDTKLEMLISNDPEDFVWPNWT